MRHLTRAAALLATSAVLATALGAPAHAAPEDRAGNWLEKQVRDGLVVSQYRDTFTDPENPTWVKYEDYGLSADVAFALEAVGEHRRDVRRISAAVAENVDAYTAPQPGEVYAGPVAKAAVLALVSGRDPRSFGGVDLIARLEGQVADAGPNVGRVEDTSAYGDNANVIGQAYAVQALGQVDSPEAGTARSFLLAQQCTAGFFRLYFSDKVSADQSCDAAGSPPSTDTTALALLALDALPSKGKAVRSAMRQAKAWLKETQKSNGSFGGGASDEPVNSNSTGLAAWALGETGSCARATRAARWLKKLQVGGRLRGTPFAGDKGAIAYDKDAYAEGEDKGITRSTRYEWRRSTAQAAPGVRFRSGC